MLSKEMSVTLSLSFWTFSRGSLYLAVVGLVTVTS